MTKPRFSYTPEIVRKALETYAGYAKEWKPIRVEEFLSHLDAVRLYAPISFYSVEANFLFNLPSQFVESVAEMVLSREEDLSNKIIARIDVIQVHDSLSINIVLSEDISPPKKVAAMPPIDLGIEPRKVKRKKRSIEL